MSPAPLNHTHLEANLEGFFRQRVRALGGYTEKIVGMSKGCPDRLVLFPGGAIYLVELKADTGSVEPMQKMWHSRASALGTKVYVVTGREGVVRWLRSVTNAHARAMTPPSRRGRKDLSEEAL